jgi:hypothetical protein
MSSGTESDADPSLAAYWRRRQLPLLPAIYHADGRVVSMLVTGAALAEAGRFSFSASPGHETTITCLDAAREPLGSMTLLEKPAIDRERNLSAYCGEGGMGADGYVALIRADDDEPIWIAFFDASNPFVSVELTANNVIAMSSHGNRWNFPIEAPEKVTVE